MKHVELRSKRHCKKNAKNKEKTKLRACEMFTKLKLCCVVRNIICNPVCLNLLFILRVITFVDAFQLLLLNSHLRVNFLIMHTITKTTTSI